MTTGKTEKVTDESHHALAWSPDSSALAVTVPFVAGRQTTKPPIGAKLQIAYLEFPVRTTSPPGSQLKYDHASANDLFNLSWTPDSTQLTVVERTALGRSTLEVFDPRGVHG